MKKGFTLVELIAVIIIIGIIAMITFPIVNNSIQKSKEKALERTIDNIISASYNYSIKNDLGEYHYDKPLDIKTLIDSGYLEDKAINPVNNEELEGCVLYRWDESNNQYEFKYDIECKYDTDPTITLSYDSSLINSYGLVKENMPVTLSGNGTIKYCISDKECEPNEIAGENMYTKFLTNDGINYICALTSNSIGDSETKCANFEIDKTIPVINDVIKTSDEETYISIEVNATDNDEILNYYYSINNREYTSSTKNNFTFTGLSKGTDYTISVYVEDKAGNKSEIVERVFITKEIKEIGKYLINNPTTGLDVTTSYDGMYRYIGVNADNYVSLNGVIYRIIGITSENNNSLGLKANQIKIIKNTIAGTTKWENSVDANVTWQTSYIYKYLANTLFKNTSVLPTEWQSKVSSVKWYIGSVSGTTSVPNATTAVSWEHRTITTSALKIGLINLSDYYYAYTPNGTANCRSSKCISWLSTGNSEYSLIRMAYGTMNPFYISYDGHIGYSYMTGTYKVRPVFYLNTDVIILSGTGTASDPFILQ